MRCTIIWGECLHNRNYVCSIQLKYSEGLNRKNSSTYLLATTTKKQEKEEQRKSTTKREFDWLGYWNILCASPFPFPPSPFPSFTNHIRKVGGVGICVHMRRNINPDDQSMVKKQMLIAKKKSREIYRLIEEMLLLHIFNLHLIFLLYFYKFV